MAWLVRQAGYPARVAFGFTRGSTGQPGATVTLTNLNLHAWTEVYFAGIGWVPFDATPAASGPRFGEPCLGPQPRHRRRLPTTAPGAASAGPERLAGGGRRRGRPTTRPTGDTRAAGTVQTTRAGPRSGRWWTARRARPAGSCSPCRHCGAGRCRDDRLSFPAELPCHRSRQVPSRAPPADRGYPGSGTVLGGVAGRDAAREDAHAAWDELLDTLVDFRVPVDRTETPRGTADRLVADAHPERRGRRPQLLGRAEERARYAQSPQPADELVPSLTALRTALSAGATRRTRLRAYAAAVGAACTGEWPSTRAAKHGAAAHLRGRPLLPAAQRRDPARPSGRLRPTGPAANRPRIRFAAGPSATVILPVVAGRRTALIRTGGQRCPPGADASAPPSGRGTTAAVPRGRVGSVVPPTTCRSGSGRGGTTAYRTRRASMTTKPATPSSGVLIHAVDEQGQPSNDHTGSDEHATPRVETRVAGANGRGEFGVLGKRPLDLLEQPLLVLRERHGTPPRSRWSGPLGPTDRGSQPAAYPQVYEGARASESGTTYGRACDFFAGSRPPGHACRARLAGSLSETDRPEIGQPRRRPPPPPPASRAPARRRMSCRRRQLPGRRAASPSTRTPTRRIGSPGSRAVQSAQAVSKISRATSVGTARVRDRLTVRKSASRTLSDTVRPTCPAARSRTPTLSASASRARRISSGSATSVVEGHLGADRLLHLLRADPARVPAPGQLVQVRARRPRRAARRSMPDGRLGHVADGGQAEPAQRLRGPLPHPPQRRHRQRMQEVEHPVAPAPPAGRPAWPGSSRAWPRTCVGATPTEQVSRCSLRRPGADQPGDLGRAAEQPPGAGHVEERLVQGERLDQRGDVPEDPPSPPGRPPCSREVGRQEDRVRAERPGPDAVGIALRTPYRRAS